MFKNSPAALGAVILLLSTSHAYAQQAPRDTQPASSSPLSSSGEEGEGFRGWIRGLLSSAHQGVRDGQSGYDSDSAGVAFGVDTHLKTCPAVVGVGISYTNTDIDASNASTTHTDVDSYQLSVYGDYKLPRDMFVRGALSYTFDSNSSTRHNTFGPGVSSFGDYDADQFSALLRGGKRYNVGGAVFTPSLMTHLMHYAPDSYSETGPGLGNLFTSQASMNVAEIGAGLDTSWVFDANDGSGGFSPGLHFNYSFDLAADRIETQTSPVGGGPVTTTFGPSVAKSRFNAGADILWFNAKGWDFKAGYDVDVKQDYFAQSGNLRVTGKF